PGMIRSRECIADPPAIISRSCGSRTEALVPGIFGLCVPATANVRLLALFRESKDVFLDTENLGAVVPCPFQRNVPWEGHCAQRVEQSLCTFASNEVGCSRTLRSVDGPPDPVMLAGAEKLYEELGAMIHELHGTKSRQLVNNCAYPVFTPLLESSVIFKDQSVLAAIIQKLAKRFEMAEVAAIFARQHVAAVQPLKGGHICRLASGMFRRAAIHRIDTNELDPGSKIGSRACNCLPALRVLRQI